MKPRKKIKADSKPTALTFEQVVASAAAAGVKVTVSLTPLPDKLPERKMPGTPFNRTLLATEASDAQIKKAFKDEPSSLWVLTPTRTISRAEFFANPKLDKPVAAPKD